MVILVEVVWNTRSLYQPSHPFLFRSEVLCLFSDLKRRWPQAHRHLFLQVALVGHIQVLAASGETAGVVSEFKLWNAESRIDLIRSSTTRYLESAKQLSCTLTPSSRWCSGIMNIELFQKCQAEEDMAPLKIAPVLPFKTDFLALPYKMAAHVLVPLISSARMRISECRSHVRMVMSLLERHYSAWWRLGQKPSYLQWLPDWWYLCCRPRGSMGKRCLHTIRSSSSKFPPSLRTSNAPYMYMISYVLNKN